MSFVKFYACCVLLVLVAIGGFFVNCPQSGGSFADGGLFKIGSFAELFENAGFFKLLFKAFQCFVNGFVVFDAYDNHIVG